MDILHQLRIQNAKRCPAFGHTIEDWELPRWGNALAGEVGELCNIIKKLDRGVKFDRDGMTPLTVNQLADEAADIVIYLDLLCQKAGIDLSTSIVRKFNQRSDEMGNNIRLYFPDLYF